MPELGDRVRVRRQIWLHGAGVYSEDIREGVLVKHTRYRAVRDDAGRLHVVSDTDPMEVLKPTKSMQTESESCSFCTAAVTRAMKSERTWSGLYHQWCLAWLCRALRESIPKE